MTPRRSTTSATPVTLVVTVGDGSMDRYGARLAEHLEGVGVLQLDLRGTSAGAMGVAALSRRSLRGLRGDAGVVRTLRSAPGVPHFASHHLARYGPLLGRPYLVTAHDLIRWHDVHRGTGYISHPRMRDRIWTQLDCRGVARAAGVIAPSEATRRELIRELGIPAARVVAVPHGLNHRLFRPVLERPLPGRYVLFVGSEHPRKGLITLLGAFAGLRRRGGHSDLRLVKVGDVGTSEAPFRAKTLAAVRELGLQDCVVFTGRVPDHELPAYYSGAACLVLPSRAEGFGLPSLEAMACGCPAIVSSAGALPEVTGDAAIVVEPGNADVLRSAIERLLDDDRAREELRQRGLAHAARFSWQRTAEQTSRVYEALLAYAPPSCGFSS